MNFNEAIEIAKRTWYRKDHELHMNPHHPLGKLLGEWGELLDDYMKALYKPGYVFEPEDELGDIWYYTRILCYQNRYEPKNYIDFKMHETDVIIVSCLNPLSDLFLKMNEDDYTYILNKIYSAIIEIAKRYNLTLDDLTASNWQKLKPGSERGEQWRKTDYVGLK